MVLSCTKCQKTLSSKAYLQKHEEKCNGLTSLQCELCQMTFANKSSKSTHKKNKVCERNGTMINNNTLNHSNHNTITQIQQQIINNHYHIHIGNENLEYLPENIKNGFAHKYLDPKVLTEFHKLVHFNTDHPENHVISKTDLSRNEYHVKFQDGVVKIKFEEMYSLLHELYEKIDGKLIEPWGDWKVDEDGVNTGENIAQRNERIRQLKSNMKTILFGLSKQNPKISDKIRKQSKKIPLKHPQPDLNF